MSTVVVPLVELGDEVTVGHVAIPLFEELGDLVPVDVVGEIEGHPTLSTVMGGHAEAWILAERVALVRVAHEVQRATEPAPAWPGW